MLLICTFLKAVQIGVSSEYNSSHNDASKYLCISHAHLFIAETLQAC